MKVNNMSAKAMDKQYVVIRLVNGEAWYFGAWDDCDKAVNQAMEIGGVVLPTADVQM